MVLVSSTLVKASSSTRIAVSSVMVPNLVALGRDAEIQLHQVWHHEINSQRKNGKPSDDCHNVH